MESEVASALITGVLGGFIGAIATYLVAHRQLRSNHITSERQKWREKIRTLGAMLVNGSDEERRNVWFELAMNTNPFDEEDRALVALARKVAVAPPSQNEREELAGRLALLLKHDWQRAKDETSWFPKPAEFRAQRLPYAEYQPRYPAR